MAQEASLKGTRKFNQALTAVRSTIGTDVSAQLVQTFCLVALNEGRGVGELADLAAASKSTMSRHLLDLSEKLRTGADGYHLLERRVDPSNMRAVVYTLSKKGKLLLNTIEQAMEE